LFTKTKLSNDNNKMHLKTILNQVTNYKSFVFGKAEFVTSAAGRKSIEVEVLPRKNSKRICSGCQKPGPGYDTSPETRRFDFVPLYGMAVVFLYSMRRVDCATCGVKVEQVPWANGNSPTTKELSCFLARWAKHMSWKEIASIFHVSWDCVYQSVKTLVQWGLIHRDLSGIKSIGVDEVQWKKGHRYQTIVYQIDAGCKRLLWIGPDRTAKTLLRFFRFFGKERTAQLQFICSDMWQAYIKVIRKKASQAVHILDRFHVMQQFSKAINEVRAAEAKQLVKDGYEPVLKGAKWLLLKRPENLTDHQAVKMKELLQYNLKSIRSHLMKEDFQRFWEYTTAGWAGKFLDQWCKRTMSSKIEPMKKVAKTLRSKKELILNWFRAEGALSSGVVEGLNNKLKLVTRKSYGFRTQEAYEIALYHNLGDLPEPEITHRFF
jgi:transposase